MPLPSHMRPCSDTRHGNKENSTQDIAANVVDFAHTEPGGTRSRDFGLGLLAGLFLGGGFAMSLAVAQVRRPEAMPEPS